MEGSSAMMPINKQSQETNTEISNEEPNAKFIKLFEDITNNLDPLEYFSRFIGIPEMILNRLSGQELIKYSEVSPLWYNCIASAKVLMENIKVVFSEKRELQTEDYDLLKNSSRKYQNIEVRRSIDWQGLPSEVLFPSITESDCILKMELDFLLKARDWKIVSIIDTNFRTKMDVFNFLLSIESSVESFYVRNSFDGNAFPFDDESSYYTKRFKILEFPKLKHLKMHFSKFYSMGLAYAELFSKSVAIEKFDLIDSFGYISRLNFLTKLLVNSKKLTSLSLETSTSDMFKEESWKRVQFKLKYLFISVQQMRGLFETNLWEFITSQKDHLEEFNIFLDHEIEVFKKIFSRTLKIQQLDPSSSLFKDVVPNVISTSITHLKCIHMMDLFKFVMRSLPNTKGLTLNIIDNETFETLLEMNRKYEELKVGHLEVGVKKKDRKVLLINANGKCLLEDWFLQIN